jgi:hypothetical protein
VAGLDRVRELGARESGLAIVVAGRSDGSPYASVVNAGVIDHPLTGEPVVAFVARGGTRKLPNLRRRPRVTVVFRSGWDWLAVEGDVELAGPDDVLPSIEPAEIPALLRLIYAAAVGGTSDDWRNLDAVFVEERHTAVLIRPVRTHSSLP